MRGNVRRAAVVVMSAAAMLSAGCSGGDDTSAGRAGGEITVSGCTPAKRSLIPSDTTEECGGRVVDAVFARLVRYDPETAEPQNDLAESIETDDNQTFTITLKTGRTFHDGTEITAKNFVDAWNYAAYGPNAQAASYFMEPIEGYADTQCAGPDDEDPCEGFTPKAKTLTGLTVVNDTTFTVKTTQKVPNFPLRVGYYVFAPLPDAFFANPKAFGEKPVGSGPYQFESWTKEQSIVLSKFADYSGDFGGKVDKVTFKIYSDSEAAYRDVVGNNLDITDVVPASALIDDKYRTDLPDRNAQEDVGLISMIAFPPVAVDPAYADPRIRKAISMAIDRETIIEQILNGGQAPATGWVSPIVDGYRAGACGEFCTYDTKKAKALLDDAGGFTGTITLSYNAGEGDNRSWTEAVCNSIKDALEVACQATPVVDFATFRTQITERKMTGMFRTGWQMDYPSIENFLAPLYATGGSSNDGDYANPAFDALLQDAAAEQDAAASNAKYQEAEALLRDDFPTIPLWYSRVTFGWSDRVTNVKPTIFGTLDLTAVARR
ncbi:MAG: peptide ABC transporter substrate-binding protein [Dermatophilaceae bacterium]